VREEAKSLAEFHVSTFAVNAEMKSDSTVQAAAIVKSCTLTDRRRGRNAGMTQYVHVVCLL